MRERVRCIDYLKTLAIISVVLYHIGVLKNGYLGVEIFFVVSGYLFMKSNKEKLEEGKFKPIEFLLKKVVTFWPLIIVGGLLCLMVGFFYMLPDDYENLAQSVFASNVFANNILQAITTKDYWNTANVYKPLMHTWYIGVLVQNYVLLAFGLWGIRKVCKEKSIKYSLIVIGILSLTLYLLPVFSGGDKFYYPHFRLFEMVSGGLIVYLPSLKMHDKVKRIVGGVFSVIIVGLLGGLNIFGTLGVLFIVVATAGILYVLGSVDEKGKVSEKLYRIVTIPGRHSYDVYVWHQIVVALAYYFVFQDISMTLVVLVIFVSIVLSVLSVVVRKKCAGRLAKNHKFLLTLCVMVVSSGIALLIYVKAGVMRDIPELGIDVNNAHRNMHAEYVDIPYTWDKDFMEEDKVHILVIGNSFGRDFANILNESYISDKIEISYFFGDDVSAEMDRVEQAEYVFYGTNSWEISEWVLDNVDREKLYIVGNKSFGNSNGIIYVNKNKPDYFSQTIRLSDEFIVMNANYKREYGEKYIDMISPLLEADRIKVFTDDKFFISQDGKHLTKQGAQYYARVLNFDFIIEDR